MVRWIRLAATRLAEYLFLNQPKLLGPRPLFELFGFDYQIECYTPAAKRKYGYFTLPILHVDRMVGRLDPKAHRTDGVMEVRTLHLEPGVKPTADLVDGLRDALAQFAEWHGTPEVVVRKAAARGLAKALGTG